MTPLSSAIRRVCPEIVDTLDRPLIVALTPEDGGSMVMRWQGSRKETEVTVELRDLMDYAEGQTADTPEEGTPVKVDPTTIRFDDLVSILHTVSDLEMKERVKLIGVARDLRDYRAWLSNNMPGTWANWKLQQQKEHNEQH